VAGWKRELLPRATFVNEYGPTEAVVGCTVWALSDGRALEGLEVRAAAPIGRPIGNTRVYVLDSQMWPAPEGVAGEIYIGGARVARGYVNLPGLTAERFVPDPYVEGGRLYKTGDVGLWAAIHSRRYGSGKPHPSAGPDSGSPTGRRTVNAIPWSRSGAYAPARPSLSVKSAFRR